MKNSKYIFQKFITGLLALVFLIGKLPEGNLFAAGYENYLDGWTVGIMWSTLSTEYEWNATANERRQPKLFVTYRTDNADRTYEPGELSFTITGIGNAVRGTIVKASDVAADYGAPDKNSNNKWWYTWDPVTDTYTFYNKDEIKEDESVSGGFEMLWTFNARDNTTDYFDTVEATFSVKSDNPGRDGTDDGIDETITLPPLRYHFTSITDDYRIKMEESALSPEEWELADPDYVWYDINTNIRMQVIRSRGLYASSYFVTIDLPGDAVPGEDFVVMDSSGNDISSKLTWDEETETWGFYLFEERSGDIPSSLGGYRDFSFRLGLSNEYKKEHLNSGEKVTVHGHLDRLYLDEGSDWTTENKQDYPDDRFDYNAQDLVDDELYLSFDDYDYESDGYIYAVDKDGPYSYLNEGRSQPTNYGDRLRAQNLYGKGITLQYTLYGAANRHWATAAGLSAGTSLSAAAGRHAADIPTPVDEEPKPGISGIQDGTEWSMVLGDDKLAIVLADGTIRNLDDSEYDMTYVRVSSNTRYGGAKEYEVYYALTQDTPFDEYIKLEGTWTTAATETINLPAGTKAVFVRINGLVGSYYQYVYVGVHVHLEEDALKNFGSGEKPDHEKFFVNFSYMRAMYTPDGRTEEIDDTPDSAYSFDYGTDLKARDRETYGEDLFRDYAKAFLRTDVVTINTSVDIRPLETTAEQDYYDTTLKATGSISADNEGELKQFSLYVVLPKGIHVNWNEASFPFTGSAVFKVGEETVDFNQYVMISEGEYDGCDMIIFDFDFSMSPLEISEDTNFSVEFPAYLRYTDFAMLGARYTAYSYVVLHDQGIDRLVGRNLVADTGDIDQDGDVTERIARDMDYEDVDDTARQWSSHPYKYLKSAYSDGYIQETVVQRYHEEEWEELISGCYYSYRMDYTASSVVTDIVFFDMLESGAVITEGNQRGEYESDWHGIFLGADISRVTELGGTATVYYSENPDRPWVQPEKGTEAGGWKEWTPETDPALVKAIAVDVDTTGMPQGRLAPGTLLYVEINMLAPSAPDLLNKKAVNQFSVYYSGYDPGSGSTEQKTLDSNMTELTLLETVGDLLLQKVDADNMTSTDAIGNERYVHLTGGKFRVTNEKGEVVFEGSTNALGRIMVNNIPYGTYYVEELEAPDGYKKTAEKWKFIVDAENTEANTLYNLKNNRLPGEVVLTKQDAQYEGYGPLSGAKFELYTSNGTPVYAVPNGDGSYTYTQNAVSDAVSEFITGEDGQIHITELPWGSYYFVEIEAPEGYEQPDPENPVKISFAVDAARYEAPENGESDGRVVAYVNVKNNEILQSIRLVKKDADSNAPVEGATFSLYRKVRDGEANDTLIAELLQTDQMGRIEVNDLGFGTYYFIETRNATGYDMPVDPKTGEITLDAGTIGKEIEELSVEFTNERLKGRVELTKTDDFDQYVEGAVYELFYKAEGDTVFISKGMFTTDEDAIIRVYDLEWGEYYFVEVSAPQGYAVSDKHWEFTVDRNNVSNVISVAVEDERAKGSIRLTKVDKDNETTVLEGAEYELYTSAGVKMEPGVDYTTDRPDNRIITGMDGTVTISGLRQGGYYLQEIVPPAGYSLSGDYIRFSIGLGTSGSVVQEIIARDEKGKAVIVVNKKINDIYEEFGNPTFIFTVVDACEDPDCGNHGRTYTKSITLSGLQREGSVSFTVDANHKYIVKEMIAARYKLKDIGTAGLHNIESVNVSAGTATTVKLTGENGLERAEVTFTNEIEQYGKVSHTDSATNMVKARSRLTAITAMFTGPNPITDESVRTANGGYVKQYDPNTEDYTFDEAVLTVTAYYDDGTSKVLRWENLDFDEFMLSEWFIPGGTKDTSHTIHVSYTENGVTCTDQFQVETDLTYAPRYTVVLDCNDGSILPDANWANGGSMTAYVEKLEKTNLKTGAVITLPVTEAVKTNRDFAGWTLTKYTDSTAPEGTKIYAPGETLTVTAELIAQLADGNNTITLYAYYVGYTVKYAVRIYGIQEDYDGNGNLTGLTFGPAGGKDYTGSYEAHLTETEFKNGSEFCIHWMEWEDIVEQSRKDPTVFQTCLENGCTHSVELRIKGEIAGTSFAGKMENGDGAGVLLNSVNAEAEKFSNIQKPIGGWEVSRLRNTLNGVQTRYGQDKVNEANALIAMFPEELQKSIVAKQVLSVSTGASGSDKINNLVTTYDKLWIFSIRELISGSSYADAREGSLYSGQKFFNTNALKLYNEVGASGKNADYWTRTTSWLSGSAKAVVYLRDGSPAAENAWVAKGLAFGFCLPGPDVYTTKYAVRIYGIGEDVDENGDAVGLTFGPASGKNYANTYACHMEAEDYVPEEGELCIHNMTWVEIAEQSKKDPEVFRKCLEYGCTHSVLLNIEGELAGNSYAGKLSGDGASTLRFSIADVYRKYNTVNTSGGWPAYTLRNVLNGVQTTYGTDFDENTALIAMFPQVVRERIVAREVTSYTDVSGNDTGIKPQVTYDKLWIFSTSEYFTTISSVEGTTYSSQQFFDVTSGSASRMLYDEDNNGKSGTQYSTRSRTLYHNTTGYMVSKLCGYQTGTGGSSVTDTTSGIAPGFCLPGPETGTHAP